MVWAKLRPGSRSGAGSSPSPVPRWRAVTRQAGSPLSLCCKVHRAAPWGRRGRGRVSQRGHAPRAPRGPAAPPARPGGRGGMSRQPRAAEPSPPARRRNETRVKVDRESPFWRGGRAANGRRGRRRRRRAPQMPRHPPPPPPPPPVRGWLPARRRPPRRAPLRALPFTVAPEGQKKGATGGVSRERSPPIPGTTTLGTGGSITTTGQPW